MIDRMNAVENFLLEDFQREAVIRNEFKLIEIGFRDDANQYKRNELPALIFECIECEDGDMDTDNGINVWEREYLVILIVCYHAKRSFARKEVKRFISLVRDFLKSDQWRYMQESQIGRSGFEISRVSEKAFRSVGGIDFTIDVYAK